MQTNPLINLCGKKILDVGMRESLIPKFLRTYNWVMHVDYARPYTEWIHTGRVAVPIYHSSTKLEYKFVERNDAKQWVRRLFVNFECTKCGENVNKCKYIK